MSTLPRTTEGRHGLTPFRLADVPIKVRRTVGSHLARVAADDGDLMARVSVERAVEFPSDRVYWIPTDAWVSATRRRSWR